MPAPAPSPRPARRRHAGRSGSEARLAELLVPLTPARHPASSPPGRASGIPVVEFAIDPRVDGALSHAGDAVITAAYAPPSATGSRCSACGIPVGTPPRGGDSLDRMGSVFLAMRPVPPA